MAAAAEYEGVKEPAPTDCLVRVNEFIEKIANPGVPSWIGAGGYNYDSLVVSLGERLAMFEAKVNYALYHKKDFDDVSDSQVRESSAGVFGWSEAKVEQWSVGCPLIPGSTGSSMDLPNATEDDWHGIALISRSPRIPQSRNLRCLSRPIREKLRRRNVS